MDVDLGTREEDWPDIDVDSDTEEGAEAVARAEAALHATIDRSIRQRNADLAGASIPHVLYVKAQKHQDQLTQEERRKSLAQPEALTIDEIHEVRLWPPPYVVLTNIQRATNGTLKSPSELNAKAKHAMERGVFEAELNAEEIALLARGFHAPDDVSFSWGAMLGALGAPGSMQAMGLLSTRLGLDASVLQAASLQHMRPVAPASPSFDGQLARKGQCTFQGRNLGPHAGPEALVSRPHLPNAAPTGLQWASPLPFVSELWDAAVLSAPLNDEREETVPRPLQPV